jgi:hypothetical protein
MPTSLPIRHRAAFATAITSTALVLSLLGGCSTDNPMHHALRNSLSFGGPTEAGFNKMVERGCGQEYVGGQSVATLMTSDTSFRQLTARLYRGDISTDAFTNQLLQEYPAADANIPATGCIAKQLNTCLSSSCDGGPVVGPDSIEADRIDADRDRALDGLPPAERAQVDELITDPAAEIPTTISGSVNVEPEEAVDPVVSPEKP